MSFVYVLYILSTLQCTLYKHLQQLQSFTTVIVELKNFKGEDTLFIHITAFSYNVFFGALKSREPLNLNC